jgi:hypothetical protein
MRSRSNERIYVDTGNGGTWLTSWDEVWSWMWAAVAYAMHYEAHGACRCGCDIADCAYCVAEGCAS